MPSFLHVLLLNLSRRRGDFIRHHIVPILSLFKFISVFIGMENDLFAEINRVYVEDVEDEKVLILSDETCKEVKEDHKDYKN